MKKYFGCSGWYYDHWKNKFYPQNLKKSEWLVYYSSYFNTVEINNTFYGHPSDSTFRSWYHKTPSRFRFTLKGSRFITHIKKLNNIKESLNMFYNSANILAEKIGCILWQLPPYMKRNDELLLTFCKTLDPNFKNVIEFRHASWFSEHVYNILSGYGITFCSLSTSELPDELIVTSPISYIRLHGKSEHRYRYNYRINELNDLSEKINNLKVKEVYVYFNNDYNAHAVYNCLTLKKLNEKAVQDLK
jgi:uncharacterized protein YecE (DUF72 family)